jgi:hypothetical protein
MAGAKQNLDAWFEKLSNDERKDVLRYLYGDQDLRVTQPVVEGLYLGPSPGLEKKGYHLGPAPTRACPTCGRPM